MDLHDEINDINGLIERLNFIYSESAKEGNLSQTVLNWIQKEKNNIFEKIPELNDDPLAEWLTISKKVMCIYQNYLEKIKDKKIKILIVSEAPMLTLDGHKFVCNYILGEGSVGSYRTVPYESIWEQNKIEGKKPDDYKTNPEKIIELFIENNVAFVDLIPFPLPKIPTDLRKDWKVKNDRNFIISLFKNAVSKIQYDKFSDDLKIIFMMPPTTASGIIEYCILNKDNIDDKFLNKYLKHIIRCNDNSIFENKQLFEYSIKLHRQIVMSGAGGPEKNLFLNALKN